MSLDARQIGHIQAILSHCAGILETGTNVVPIHRQGATDEPA